MQGGLWLLGLTAHPTILTGVWGRAESGRTKWETVPGLFLNLSQEGRREDLLESRIMVGVPLFSRERG